MYIGPDGTDKTVGYQPKDGNYPNDRGNINPKEVERGFVSNQQNIPLSHLLTQQNAPLFSASPANLPSTTQNPANAGQNAPYFSTVTLISKSSFELNVSVVSQAFNSSLGISPPQSGIVTPNSANTFSISNLLSAASAPSGAQAALSSSAVQSPGANLSKTQSLPSSAPVDRESATAVTVEKTVPISGVVSGAQSPGEQDMSGYSRVPSNNLPPHSSVAQGTSDTSIKSQLPDRLAVLSGAKDLTTISTSRDLSAQQNFLGASSSASSVSLLGTQGSSVILFSFSPTINPKVHQGAQGSSAILSSFSVMMTPEARQGIQGSSIIPSTFSAAMTFEVRQGAKASSVTPSTFSTAMTPEVRQGAQAYSVTPSTFSAAMTPEVRQGAQASSVTPSTFSAAMTPEVRQGAQASSVTPSTSSAAMTPEVRQGAQASSVTPSTFSAAMTPEVRQIAIALSSSSGSMPTQSSSGAVGAIPSSFTAPAGMPSSTPPMRQNDPTPLILPIVAAPHPFFKWIRFLVDFW